MSKIRCAGPMTRITYCRSYTWCQRLHKASGFMIVLLDLEHHCGLATAPGIPASWVRSGVSLPSSGAASGNRSNFGSSCLREHLYTFHDIPLITYKDSLRTDCVHASCSFVYSLWSVPIESCVLNAQHQSETGSYWQLLHLPLTLRIGGAACTFECT